MTLTRNQSAKLFADIVGQIETRAPKSTAEIKALGPDNYLSANFNLIGVHSDHLIALVEMLDGDDRLDEINRHAEKMRSFMTPLAVPWYDEA